MDEEVNDNVDLVMCTLADVLGEKKFSLIDRNDVTKELSEVNGDADMNDVDYTGSFHPYKKIDLVVKHFVSMHKKKRKLDEVSQTEIEISKNDNEELELEEEDNEVMNAEVIKDSLGEDEKTELLTSLINVYPDVDPKLLQQICARLHHDAPKIQEWLETNIQNIPEKRQVQAINRFTLEFTCKTDEDIWNCPVCETWQIIGNKLTVVKCSEVVSCGEFCKKCSRRAHAPFICRRKCQRIDIMENEVDIFKKLRTVPDEDKGYAKIFILRPQNNLNFSDPLHILYLAAEGTFLRMIDLSNQATTSQGNIQGTQAQATSTSSSSQSSLWTNPPVVGPGVVPSMIALQPTGCILSTSGSTSSDGNAPTNGIGPSGSVNSLHPLSSPATSSAPPVSPASSPSTRSQQLTAILMRLQMRRRRFSSSSIGMGRKSIQAIKYIENENLRGRFNSCKSYFLSRGIPNNERLVFHGTSASLDSIIKNNFKLSLCKRFLHGKGIYFSEFPSTSQIYGKHLLLCRVMLGNPYQAQEPEGSLLQSILGGSASEQTIPAQYQSKIVQPNEEGKANMIIIDNEDQILPAFIIELKDMEPHVTI